MKLRLILGLALIVLIFGGVVLLSRPPRPANPAATAAISPASPTPPPSVPASATASTRTTTAPTGPPLAAYAPGRAGAHPVPSAATKAVPQSPPPLDIGPNFLATILDADGKTVRFPLPGGGSAAGRADLVRRDSNGIVLVQGRLTSPEPGFYFFSRQTAPGVAGAFFGSVRFDHSPVAYRLEPTGSGGATQLVARHLDQVICAGLPSVDAARIASAQRTSSATSVPAASSATSGDVVNAPQTYPTNIPIPAAQHGIIPLQSLPGASAVIFLDFEGGPGPWVGWGSFAVQPANVTNDQIKEVWQRVAEDYQPFNVNVTTDRAVFLAAPKNSRQRCMLTTTNTAAPGAGGVALEGSFNSTNDAVCWAFYTSGKAAAEVAAHEVGHTVGLSHETQDFSDGTHNEYYTGHGTDPVGWAPIMGAGYYKNLTQWSKGEFPNASNKEDQVAIIANNNNVIRTRTDDYGADFASAGYLEIQNNNSVSNEGILETRDDVDAFKFTTAGGAVSLTATPVSQGPDLDILAEIYNASNVLVASNNPDANINATVAATLPAGNYTLRVSGVGRGDPLSDGYTDYGSIGAYLITGTVAGGVKPVRFSLAENSAVGTSVGTVIPRNSHGSNPLTYAIASGNPSGAFAIDPATGALTVSNPAPIDYESLSTRWDVPAAIPLFVTITDAANSALNETLRVVVTLTDVNEPPVVTGSSAIIFARTRVGTAVSTVIATDPDHFDFPTYAIADGNSAGLFAIDAGTGAISIAAVPTTAGTSNLIVQVSDQGTPKNTVSVTVPITIRSLTGTYQPGVIPRTYYESITGNGLSNLTSASKFPNSPDSQETLTTLAGGTHGDNYGSTITGYLIPPTTGAYTFWIASDDASELRLSSSSNSSAATVRASLSGAVVEGNFTQNSSQKSSAITLTAGVSYYLEVRHKEGGGSDFVEVAWQGPGMTAREIIPGRYLAPATVVNRAPALVTTALSIRKNAVANATVGTLAITDFNPTDLHTFTLTGGTGAGMFGLDAQTGRVFVTDVAALAAATAASYTLNVTVADDASLPLSGSGTVTITLLDPAALTVDGIVRQIWWNFHGSLSALPSFTGYPYAPNASRVLANGFTAANENMEYYGSRVRAYLVPPTTGSYRLYVATDDDSQLFLSTSESPSAAAQVASVSGSVSSGQWTAQSSQTSSARTLVAGHRYYIEIRHRQAAGNELFDVGWTGPGITSPTVIPASALQPYDLNAAPVWSAIPSLSVTETASLGSLIGTLTAVDPEGRPLTYAVIGGTGAGRFALDPATGRLTLADNSSLAPGSYSLAVTAQDEGLDGQYPLKSAATTVTIHVVPTIQGWRQRTFGADSGNSAIAGNSADPDGDGLPNALEYALGLDPTTANVSPVTVDLVTISGQRYLRLTAPRNPDAPDVTLAAEVTGDLKNAGAWTASDVTVLANTAILFQVRDTVPVSAALSRAIRLKVTAP